MRLLAGLCLVAAPALDAQTLKIDHQAVGCAVADRFPRLWARFDPADRVVAARVLFQPRSSQHWYAVAMTTDGPTFAGVLPKPKKSLEAYRYYIEVTDKTAATNRTPDYTTEVVGRAAECQGKMMAAALASASVLLQVPAGAAAVPAGFASTSVVAAGSGSAAAGAGAAAAGGGGLSTAAVLGIVAGVGAVGAGVAVAAGGEARPNTMEGSVFRRSATGPSQPIQGAVVSTSLDSRTAVTDAAGSFRLETATAGVQDYTLTITASGCQTYSNTARWGNHPTGQRFELSCP